MSQTTTLAIDRSTTDLEGTIEAILLDFAEMPDDYEIRPVFNADQITEEWAVTIESRWSVGGIESAAARLSLVLGCSVEVTELWNDRDADEPGSRSVVYSNGALFSEGVELQLPANLTAADVAVVPIETLRQWRGWLEQQPFPQVGRVATGIDAYLS